MAIPVAEYKNIMRQWASGVSIVTMRDKGTIHGLTISGFIGVSLDPPLALISIGQELRSHAILREGGCFAVNLLRDDQRELSNRFASKDVDRFAGLATRQAVTGAPILDQCLAWMDCRVVTVMQAGDHSLYIGEVLATGVNGGKPLLYWSGDYRQLG